MRIPSSNLGRTCCVQKLFPTFRTIYVHNMLSYCGLVDPRISASDKDLPAQMYTYLQKNMEVNFAKSKE